MNYNLNLKLCIINIHIKFIDTYKNILIGVKKQKMKNKNFINLKYHYRTNY